MGQLSPAIQSDPTSGVILEQLALGGLERVCLVADFYASGQTCSHLKSHSRCGKSWDQWFHNKKRVTNEMTDAQRELEERVLSQRWFYRYELPSGRVTEQYISSDVNQIHTTRLEMMLAALEPDFESSGTNPTFPTGGQESGKCLIYWWCGQQGRHHVAGGHATLETSVEVIRGGG